MPRRRGRTLVAGLVVAFGCSGDRTNVTPISNDAAAVRGELPFDPLQWRVIGSSVDTRGSTMSTLFGNEVAVQVARSGAAAPYHPGSVLSLVTWEQQDDVHWFGARIPARVATVEVVSMMDPSRAGAPYEYQLYRGAPLRKAETPDAATVAARVERMLHERAAVMP